MNSRTGDRFAPAKVNGVVGLILLPDDWVNESPHELNNINIPSMTLNEITESQWTSIYESLGCVFLPNVGWREGTTGPGGEVGHYWASSGIGWKAEVLRVEFSNVSWAGVYLDQREEWLGFSVRLVYNAY